MLVTANYSHPPEIQVVLRNFSQAPAKEATALTVAGAEITVLAGRRRGWAVLGGALTLLRASAKRWSIFKAGFQSASDPKYTVERQHERLARQPHEGRRIETSEGIGHATWDVAENSRARRR